ncbi:MAG TPA: hypothetical protein VFS06_06640 [Casimicrobiaceae bacterium]|jgi:hypothetical protein|nr:hypothetical protein [Casimicrobiaceae bacterium]
MDKVQLRAAARASLRASKSMPPLDRPLARTSRERAKSIVDDDVVPGAGRTPPPLDKARARQACAPMGALHSIVVTVDTRKRRRTFYIVDPDPAMATQYAAAGLDLTPGCKVLVDAEVMRPIALIDFDPAVSAEDCAPMPHGFNPYFDLPAG